MALPVSAKGLRVALFATCINDLMFPSTPKAVVILLERLGCVVEFPMEQTCCGQMFTNTGYFNDGLDCVKTYVKAFEPYEYIVGPSGSCVGAIRHQSVMLAEKAGNAKLATKAAKCVEHSYDLTEFLVDVLGLTDVGAFFPHKVTYHPTCHSVRIAKVGDRPYQLLRGVRGLELVDLPDSDTCCGFGGTFSIKNPEVSAAMAADKARNVVSTGAEYVVTGDNACLMNIGGVLHRNNTGVKPIHLAEILAHQEGDAL
ncbi:MAG: (Fe-S)-binding protein [Propionibacteriaceae bacterium]|jgi:L-lactate dehydrogenase complex protein LldE|nr:(Fe-S)-binding protein [Propionibacteriaceae bacterium]